MNRRFLVGVSVAFVVGGWGPSASAQSTPSEGPGAPVIRPKVAVVIVGDPDADALAMADRVGSVLASGEDAVSTVASAELRAALRGEPAPAEDDGLVAVRALRASLSGDESADVDGLVRLGMRAGADVIALVRRRDGAYECVVLDVGRRSYFSGVFRDGGGEREVEDARLRRLVVARADEAAAAARLARSESRSTTTPPTARPRARATSTTTTARAEARATTRSGRAASSRTRATGARRGARRSEPREEERSWIERTWPYFAAAALAGGFVGLYFLGREGDESDPLRFRFVPASSSGDTGAAP